MLDFGIARKYTVGDTKEVKLPRAKVSFLGTVRFASRACHKQLEQGRKDDLECWIYMLFDDANGLPWKRADRSKVVPLKEKFCVRIKLYSKLVEQYSKREQNRSYTKIGLDWGSTEAD
ncbi:hypothetical protein OSTOST_14912 [Ostertagia ostertagi]